MMINWWLTLIILYISCPVFIQSSDGDRYYFFLNCLDTCKEHNCSTNGNVKEYRGQSAYLKYLKWDCESECKYNCMWKTVDKLLDNDIDIPQFYGKWPFKRILGAQEPASVLFSIFNLVVHLVGLKRFRASVSHSAPFYWFWHAFTAICVNAWLWSTAFHTRDTYLTELMDYFSAFSMVIFTFFAAFVRIFGTLFCMPAMVFGLLLLSYCVYHVHYLAFVHFDYGYNMTANIAVGILNAACWLFWSGINRKSHPHAWKCSAFIILAVASILLEVSDFPPLLWFVDAHALWHLVTAPITYIWYSFLVDDCNFLHTQYVNLKIKQP